jgi:hypothetical protein
MLPIMAGIRLPMRLEISYIDLNQKGGPIVRMDKNQGESCLTMKAADDEKCCCSHPCLLAHR